VYLPLWLSVAEGRVEEEVRSLPPRIQERWKKLKASSKKKQKSKKNDPARTFIPGLLRHFQELLDALETPLPQAQADADEAEHEKREQAEEERSARVAYCERFVEWLIDLESQLPTRRFFHLVLQDAHIVEKGRLSNFAKRPEGSLFHQLLDMLAAFAAFDVNNYSGEALSDEQATSFHCRRIYALQKAAFKLFPEDLRPLAMSNIGAVQARSTLSRHLAALSPAQLRQLAEHLHLLHPLPKGAEPEKVEFLLEVLLTHHELRPSQLDKVNELALYPNEDILWDENAVPATTYTGEHCLALPKLNLQFLTFYDYLLRNFNLFRLEATYAIRSDVEDAVRRMNPRKTTSGGNSFNGWARMALPIKNFRITAVRPPKIGEKQPSAVEAEISWNLADTQGPMRHEWEEIREHDVLYLLVVKSPLAAGEQPDSSLPFREQYGVTYCRGAEVSFILDERGDKVGPAPGSRITPPGHGTRRRARVLLDPAQYQMDVERGIVDPVYGDVNIVLRRKPKENNFKAILHTIRDLMNSPAAVPAWLHDVFLGYGDPAAARGTQVKGWIDFRDTFLNYDHLRHSFPGLRIAPTTDDEAALHPPFQLRFPDGEAKDTETAVEVRPYTQKNRGPYPYDQPKRNVIPFTPKQVTAIRSAMNEVSCSLHLYNTSPLRAMTFVCSPCRVMSLIVWRPPRA
jgi:intron-binding protein aquarius